MKTLNRRGGKRWLYWLVGIIVVVGGYAYWTLSRPLPELKPIMAANQLSAATPAPKLTWPASGQAATGIVGSRVIETHGSQMALPTASTAKLITALAILNKKPLGLDQSGPTITMSASDVAIYNSYVKQGGSVVRVAAGEQISEYQMLQAIMLPSANNMADSLAIWAFGSLPAYSSFANDYVAQLGLSQTRVGTDASGFAPTTVSTAHDLVRLGEVAMRNPVLAQIVSQSTAAGLPLVNSVKNVNSLLGTSNIVGVKTGNTDQAGGVFVGAAKATVNNQTATVVTAIIGAPNLPQAMRDSLALIQSAQSNFSQVTIAPAGSIVGRYRQPWGGTVAAITSRPLTTQAWKGDSPSATVQLNSIPATTQTNQTVGSLSISKSAYTGQQSIPLELSSIPSKPPLSWRLLHP